MEERVEYIVKKDADGNTLTGEKNYRLHLPPDIPDTDFWSVIVYDRQAKLIIKNDQLWPSVFSSRKGLVVNQDDSVDIWFGPKDPAGKVNNWIQTIPGKDWTMILRLYGTLESKIDQTWRPGKLEVIWNYKSIY